MVVLFASARVFHEDARLIVFSNAPIGEDYGGMLRDLGVEVITVPESATKYVNDREVSSSFPGCLFTLDVIAHIGATPLIDEISSVCLLDSDCVFQGSIHEHIRMAEQYGIVSALPLTYPLSAQVNGQSRATLSLLFRNVWPEKRDLSNAAIELYGGELLILSAAEIRERAEDIKCIWQVVRNGIDDFGASYTEEHILSLMLAGISHRVRSAERIIKRVWTSDFFCNVDGSEGEYAILHLPAEKNRLLRNLFFHVKKNPLFFSENQVTFHRIVELRLAKAVQPTLTGGMARRLRRLGNRVKRAAQAFVG